MEDYVDSLSGEQLRNLLTTSELTAVEASIPKFEADSDTNMAEIFQNMGMNDAFDYKRRAGNKGGRCLCGRNDR